MKYLYLDPNFKPFGVEDEVECKISTWKGGEEHILLTGNLGPAVMIVGRINNSSELMRVFLAHDALTKMDIKDIRLFMPYLPYARQDKIMNIGESFSSKVFARLLNTCNFQKVYILDPHSDVGPALVENVKILHDAYIEFVKLSFNKFLLGRDIVIDDNSLEETSPCVICPDSGAYKKIFKTCKEIGFKGNVVVCNKVRNLATGEIINLEVNGDVSGKDCIIIDDICDGGRTFAEIGEKLKSRGAKTVCLIVTHGIFSYGEEQLKPHIDHIWSTNSFRDFVSNFVTFIPITKTIMPSI